jgi:triphosphoribosyl-dephospho-CoA synthetase
MNVMRGVLEDASGAKRALVRTVNEVLADRRQILLVKSFLTLQFMLSVGESTPKAIA